MSYLLVHGAGMGASCWELLTPLLDGPVVAVDLPGRGARSGVDVATVTLADCAAALIDDAAGLTDITVVAHSFAGVSVPLVLPQLADRLRHVVFLAAVVPPDGTRVLDQIDPDVRAFVEQSIDGGVYRQEREAARAMLCNDLDRPRSQWLLDRITPDSAALLAERVDLSGLAAAVPRTYVRTEQDHCYVPELQERSAERVGGSVLTLPTGHMPMVSQPQLLADLLSAITSSGG
jgi:pimeloyl-ACP methyl ester carboxylesterase